VFIGAVTFTGSVIAYGKLAGKVTSAAVKLPGGHAERRGRRHLGALPDLVFQWRGGILAALSS
jgi:NAD(P) transhydrogenase subunit beta